ncbi:hypothetical protein AMBAS45_04455 [Alteromonas macleodii str. 'Balearic Sea AD45']|nr:hypothetical protein AMBAS45_04455 [Alteromonas macleodii str. 'Balearic Sea AD45']
MFPQFHSNNIANGLPMRSIWFYISGLLVRFVVGLLVDLDQGVIKKPDSNANWLLKKRWLTTMFC